MLLAVFTATEDWTYFNGSIHHSLLSWIYIATIVGGTWASSTHSTLHNFAFSLTLVYSPVIHSSSLEKPPSSSLQSAWVFPYWFLLLIRLLHCLTLWVQKGLHIRCLGCKIHHSCFSSLFSFLSPTMWYALCSPVPSLSCLSLGHCIRFSTHSCLLSMSQMASIPKVIINYLFLLSTAYFFHLLWELFYPPLPILSLIQIISFGKRLGPPKIFDQPYNVCGITPPLFVAIMKDL